MVPDFGKNNSSNPKFWLSCECGKNVFQGYFDDAKESRVKQRFKNQVSRFKNNQDSRIKRRLNQDKY